MDDTFRGTLRHLMQARGYNIRKLAAAIYFSRSQVGEVLTGQARPSPKFAAAVDREFQTKGVLAALAQAERDGDIMKRRALVSQLGAVAGLGVASGETVAELIREELLRSAAEFADDDWQRRVSDYSREIISTPSGDLKHRLVIDLIELNRRIKAGGGSDLVRAASHLALLKGQCVSDELGDGGSPWYSAAIDLARRSGDKKLEIFMHARSATRMIWEDASPRDVIRLADKGLSLGGDPCIGIVECHVAKAVTFARMGDPRGIHEYETALDLAATVPYDSESTFDAQTRVLHAGTYVISRLGSLARNEATWAMVNELNVPRIWHSLSRSETAYAYVKRGDLAHGIETAISAVKAVPAGSRTKMFQTEVSELVAIIPDRHNGRDDLRQLTDLVGLT
ncbi:helix-turn-helix domain-containing protein [Phytohabitans houttuyneae]|uniref:HTH cro/C1-type domain-containing protein n=1 Tax=Phytohabitans houttuyneae TaxID=1076126 RepID=A0A6V8K945_9ACTN|nr:helix-turn-helix transcriptional regulator [Phytohabitans houttuyneae]GFJ78307.1 hypothetical protein Phou_024870 [Phytohabitans houttuyneae]